MDPRTSFTIEPGQPEIVLERTFDAPPALVFEAVTRPELIAQWWGPRGTTLAECAVDLRPGGDWRFVLRMPDGSRIGFGGTYREIDRPRRVVQTFRCDAYPEAESVETATLEARGKRTLLRVVVLHSSVANRDAQVQAGMEAGAVESHDRLAELLASLAAATQP